MSNIHLDQNMDENLTWHCHMCCNSANGREDIEERLAFRTQLHGLEWRKSRLRQCPTQIFLFFKYIFWVPHLTNFISVYFLHCNSFVYIPSRYSPVSGFEPTTSRLQVFSLTPRPWLPTFQFWMLFSSNFRCKYLRRNVIPPVA